MKELIVISGKGGTGKTSLMSAFASLAENKVLCDADVDAADLHLITAPDVRERYDFQGGNTAVIRADQCTQCGLCRDMCKWNAISKEFEVDPIACEGCGVCVYFCPEKAIDFPLSTCGEWFISDTRFGPMVHARLGIAEENSGRLVSLVRKEARDLAEAKKMEMILTDGPPGVGCPVIASIGGASAVLIVTEPTVSGWHDMERVVALAHHFGVPVMVCVNKSDLNLETTQQIEVFSKENGAECVGRIPFDPVFTHAMVRGQTLFEYDGASQVGETIREIWEKVRERL
ncbi:MAG: (4Fe-4S)-binding protein [Desulfobacteraceae bacterium 4572_88]|nr:MAG: (4Fe-4S)-binding protein [Desulfobacteraceae bacterium 4572_88]